MFSAVISSCRKTDDINNNIVRIYGDAMEDIGYGIAKAGDGFIISGQLTDVRRTEGENRISTAESSKRLGLIKVDNNGEQIWKYLYGDESYNVGSKAVVLDDGSVVCVGYSVDAVTKLKDVYIVKTDGQGSLISQKVYKKTGDNYNQYAVDLLKTSWGFIVLGVTDADRVATTESSGNVAGKKDILVMKLDNNLSETGNWAAGYPGNDDAVTIKEDIGGGYIVLATTDNSQKTSDLQSLNNILLVKIDLQGNFNQQRIIGGVAEENAADIEVLDDGYLVVSTNGTEASGQSAYVWELQRNIFEEPVYEHAITIESSSGSAVSFSIHSIARYKTSYFVMAGQAGSGSSSRMIVFITDDEGNLLPGKQVIFGSTGSQSVNDVISDEAGNIYAVGIDRYESNSMISLLKFRF